MDILKPKKLNRGDKIALISPSAPLACMVPHRVDATVENLKKIGLDVVLTKNALLRTDYTAGSAEERAEDLMAAFADDSISAVMSFIGGFHSNQIIEHLDYDFIRSHRKVFLGFSDITVLHMALYSQAGITTFYGPAGLTQFGEPFGVNPYTISYFEKALFGSDPIGSIHPSEEWTDELLNWFSKKDLERPREMFKNDGYDWLVQGQAEGVLVGGCITSLLHLRGTKYWPDFSGAIVFCETPESSADISKGEPYSRVDAHLTDLVLSGTFEKCNGLVWGRPKGYTPEETEKLKNIILKNLKRYDFPILFGGDFGHTDPIITIPIGVRCRLDSNKNIFEIVERATY